MIGDEVTKKLSSSIKASGSLFKDAINRVLSNIYKNADGIWDEFEESLISADVGVATTLYLIESVRTEATKRRINDPQEIRRILKQKCISIFDGNNAELGLKGDPAVVLVTGVNGVGKTTFVAKLANLLSKEKRVLISAADTFRAAAIDQISIWGKRIGIEVIRASRGDDPSAAIYDAISAARAKSAQVLIVDTAGRMHTSTNLLAEAAKMKRVIAKNASGQPSEVLLVVDSTTGQNTIMQAQKFDCSLSVTGVVVTKLDSTSKAGTILTVRNELNKSIKMLCFGEDIDAISYFDPEMFINNLFGE